MLPSPSKNDGSGERPDAVLFAAAQSEGEDVSVPKQQWIQAEPVKGSDVDALSVTSEGELYTVADQHVYKMEVPMGKRGNRSRIVMHWVLIMGVPPLSKSGTIHSIY